jgi:hypothetical protein
MQPATLLTDFQRHYRFAANGYSCPEGCRICAKQKADANGHAPGTFAYPIDTYGDEESE